MICFVFEEKTEEIKFHSHHIKGTCYEYDITINAYLDILAKVGFVRFLYCKFPQSPWRAMLFGKKLLCITTLYSFIHLLMDAWATSIIWLL